MKNLFVMIFFLLFSLSLFSQMPKSLTSIHKIGVDFKKFSNDNPQYKEKNGLLIRNKPNKSGNSWNYSLIALEKDEKNLINSMLFHVYNKTSKKHIKDKKELRQLLSNQFKENKYSILKVKNLNDIIKTNLSGKALDFAIKNLDTNLIKAEIICSDYKNIMIFFSYKDNYYIFISKFKKEVKEKIEEKKETKVEEKKETLKEEKKEISKDATDDKTTEEKKDTLKEEKKEISKDVTDDKTTEEKKDTLKEDKKEISKDATDDKTTEKKKDSPIEDKKEQPIEEKKEISKDTTDDLTIKDKNKNKDLTTDQ